MSLSVNFEGRRKVIKISSPNTPIQQILEEAAKYFNVSPLLVELKHKTTIIDRSQPYRYSNLPNNVQLDLVKRSVSAATNSGNCKIAFKLEVGENFVGTYSSALTLYDLLIELANTNRVPSDIFKLSPNLVYLNSIFNDLETFQNTTLGSLGLTGQSVRFQLRYDAAASQTQPNQPNQINSPSETKNAEPTVAPLTPQEPISKSAESAPKDECSVPMDTVETTEILFKEQPQETTGQPSAPKKPPTSDNTSDISAIKDTPLCDLNRNIAQQPEAAPIVAFPQASPYEIVKNILSNNFDAASGPALTILYKYLQNIRSNPDEPKFRSINPHNTAFQQKVTGVTGAQDLLVRVGFVYEEASQAINGSSTGLLRLNTVDSSLLAEVLRELERAMSELQLEIPRKKTKPAPTPMQGQKIQEFDPFKSQIVRNSLQPARVNAVVGASATEIKLQQLQQRREEVEGSIDSVDRCTQVLFPGLSSDSGSHKDIGSSNNSIDMDMNDSSVSNSLVQRALKLTQEDTTPLQTKALRDLEKAQKERIYTQTLIKIKFPDRIVLQGYFHPRHTIADVYQWVSSCLVKTSENPTPETGFEVFELYTSPPRTVIQPFKSTTKKSTNTDPGDNPISSLTDLKLVPAAVIYFAWKDGNLSGKAAAPDTGDYLTEELISKFRGGAETAMEGIEPTNVAYPSGVPLVPQTAEKKESKIALGSSSSGEEKTKVKSKPKWFKL